MRNANNFLRTNKRALVALALPLVFGSAPAWAESSLKEASVLTQSSTRIVGIKQINPTTVEILFSNHQRMNLDFYGENIFRMSQDNNGGIVRAPQATPSADILVENPRKTVSKLIVTDASGVASVATKEIKVEFNKQTNLVKVTNLRTGKVAFEEVAPANFGKEKVTLTLKENTEEYFFGGGVQNGRFTHKGKAIEIVNQNSWTDGGVCSPAPYYWSTNGYSMMWYTFKKGRYDFGSDETGKVKLTHESPYLDVFFTVSDGMVPLLNDFYQLTGNPVLMPKFGFYQGHLNAYNRDYWVQDDKGILFEDGKRYKESQKENGGVKESLNGEKENYQFSARAVIDRYKNNDMPFGWLLPNDGYGAGYGQTETIDGNIENLAQLADYANKNGVEIGLWTQSDLHPKEGISALLQRDIVKEVRDAKVRVLKTDVAWVGPGYSFGLNGVADVAHVIPYYGNNARPFIISLDGWAGTQRYAGIWSGDQTGGEWEYIRFHIPTYIGSGLAGQPNISSDMDGIFGGKNLPVNTRDFQWKTFTPMQLNMDGWGSNEKYPQALGEPAASINRWYLKLKAELLPYAYNYAKESVDGKPMIRAMFVDYPNKHTLGTATQYQFMYGDFFLVAPIYKNTKADNNGNDVRNGIYLPQGEWVDYFSGDVYEGNSIVNNFNAPIWKLPVFVKKGAIISMVNPNNNPSEINPKLRIYELYPYGETSITDYDDDGLTEEYRLGKWTTTAITSKVGKKNDLTIAFKPTVGSFTGFVPTKATELRINVTSKPKKVNAVVGKKKVKLAEAASKAEFEKGYNMFFYDATPNLNKYATKGSEFEKIVVAKNPQLLVKVAETDVTKEGINVTVEGFIFAPVNPNRTKSGALAAPKAEVAETSREAYTLKPTWSKVENADFYEIEFDNMLYSTIRETELLFESLSAETDYSFKIRSVNKDGRSDWAMFTAKTKANPLQFAIQDIKGETSCANQGGAGINKLFDFAETNDTWHTKYGEKAVPFEVIANLRTINQLEKFHYLPRLDSGNGTILKGTVYYSMDKETWTEAGAFDWKKNSDVKIFAFDGRPKAQYVKFAVTEAVGNYGSGRELFIFKVPGTESILPGDINKDGKIDENDLTSYMNYTGLKEGDADFGYVSVGDVNKNGLIDAYDISVVATQLEDGVEYRTPFEKINGTISVSTPKKQYNAGEVIEVQVKGTDLRSVNALSFALPYNQQELEYIGSELQGMKAMTNLTYDRLHSDRSKVLYPTFVNKGEQETLNGTADLFVLKFKAKQKVTVNFQPKSGFLVDNRLNNVKF